MCHREPPLRRFTPSLPFRPKDPDPSPAKDPRPAFRPKLNPVFDGEPADHFQRPE